MDKNQSNFCKLYSFKNYGGLTHSNPKDFSLLTTSRDGCKVFTSVSTLSEVDLSKSSPSDDRLFLPFFSAHLSRLYSNASAYPWLKETTQAFNEDKIIDLIQANYKDYLLELGTKPKRLFFRLVFSETGFELYIAKQLKSWLPDEPAKILPVNAIRPEPEVKSSMLGVSKGAYYLATESGFDEALFIDEEKQIRETAWSNIIWSEQGKFFSTFQGTLPGIIRAKLSQALVIEEKKSSLAELKERASSAYLSNSSIGLRQVAKIGTADIPTDKEEFGEMKSTLNSLIKTDRLVLND